MKVTTEKLPKSLLALDIELDRTQVEKGLDRAARRISQKYSIPGFRKGKAPRFIVENYFGRAALLEEASEDLINRSFREALEQEQIEPVGPANLHEVHFDSEPYRFRVAVPVAPTIVLPDYRSVRVPFEPSEVTDALVDEAMRSRRERHTVLRELEEPRPAQPGDQLTVQMQTFVDGEPLEQPDESGQLPETTLVIEKERLAEGLYEGLIGLKADQFAEITGHIADDHPDERVRGKDVVFGVHLLRIQERLVPEWEELPTLEEFDGTLDELRERTREELIDAAREQAQAATINSYIEQVIEQTEFDIPDAMIDHEAEHLLEEQGQQLQRYGITIDQWLQYRGQTREQALEELRPSAESSLRSRLVLREIVRAEGLSIDEEEIDAEVVRMVDEFKDENERETARNLFSTQLRATVATRVLNQKLRDLLFAIATGEAPPQGEAQAAPAGAPAPAVGGTDEPAGAAAASEPAAGGEDAEVERGAAAANDESSR